MKGIFTVVSGGEGSGKGTCIEALKEKLGDRSDIVFTREPGGTRIGEIIRGILMDKQNTDITPLTELVLFSAARAQHVDEVIHPAILSGKHVICDRFYFSTIAYQIYGRQKEPLIGDFHRINNIVISRCLPDHVIYLRVTPEVGLRRKEKSQEGKCTRFDDEKIAFHQRVLEGFEGQLNLYESRKVSGPPHWHAINTEKMPVEEVKLEFSQIICEILGIQI